MLFRKKEKKNAVDIVQEFLDKLQDVKFTIAMHKKEAEKEIKSAFKKGKIPIPGLLSRWKSYTTMNKVIDGIIQTAKYAATVVEVQSSISKATNALGRKNLQDALNGLDIKFREVQDQLSDLLRTESNFVNTVERLGNTLAPRIESLDSMTANIQNQAAEMFGEEILNLLKVESPDVYEVIPENIKKKISEKAT